VPHVSKANNAGAVLEARRPAAGMFRTDGAGVVDLCARLAANLMPSNGEWNPTAAFMEAHRRLPTMIEDVRSLVEIESPSADLNAVRRSAEAVRSLIGRRLGVTAETLLLDDVAHVRLRPMRPRILLMGHHDTVWPLGTLERLPFIVRGSVMRGPGCFDMKVGLVQAVHALSLLGMQLDDAGLEAVELLFTGDEETGSRTSRCLIEEDAREAIAVLVLEGSASGGALKVARKGAATYSLDVMGRASHAGLEPEAGVNAALELAYQVIAVDRLNDTVKQTTVTPTIMSAGTTANTVPAHARMHVDVRAWTAVEQQRVDRDIRRLQPLLAGAELLVKGITVRAPLERSASEDLFLRWNRAAERCGVPAAPGAGVGGASDGNLTAGLGVATLDGLGAVGGGAHADDEHVDISHIAGRTAVLATTIAGLLDVGGGQARGV
jgi:glutamate carboxypeptidase